MSTPPLPPPDPFMQSAEPLLWLGFGGKSCGGAPNTIAVSAVFSEITAYNRSIRSPIPRKAFACCRVARSGRSTT